MKKILMMIMTVCPIFCCAMQSKKDLTTKLDPKSAAVAHVYSEINKQKKQEEQEIMSLCNSMQKKMTFQPK